MKKRKPPLRQAFLLDPAKCQAPYVDSQNPVQVPTLQVHNLLLPNANHLQSIYDYVATLFTETSRAISPLQAEHRELACSVTLLA